jgi:hypothetical protein
VARFAGLTQFGVNRTVVDPGAWSSPRHWHSHEDEFVWVLEGELTLVTNPSGRPARIRRDSLFVESIAISEGHRPLRALRLPVIGPNTAVTPPTRSIIDSNRRTPEEL